MKLIIFDIDGTLTDTKQVDDKCFIKAFQNTFDLDIQNQDWAALKNVTDWGITEEIILSTFNRLPTSQEYEQMLTQLLEYFKIEKQKNSSQFNEIKGAKTFFKTVQSIDDYEIGIATGAWEKSAIFKLNAIGIDPKNLAFSNSNRFKSREEITMDCIQQLKVRIKTQVSEIIYLGDGAWDYNTCKNLGIRFIGIDAKNDKMLKQLGAKTTFTDYTDVPSLIRAIESNSSH